jgi:hypothetical protein
MSGNDEQPSKPCSLLCRRRALMRWTGWSDKTVNYYIQMGRLETTRLRPYGKRFYYVQSAQDILDSLDWLSKHGRPIERPIKLEFPPRNPPNYKTGPARKHLKKNCEACGAPGVFIPLQAHHCNGNRRQNNVGNIQTLCRDCHRFWHKKLRKLGLPYSKMPVLFD